jgi:hypothetical protein
MPSSVSREDGRRFGDVVHGFALANAFVRRWKSAIASMSLTARACRPRHRSPGVDRHGAVTCSPLGAKPVPQKLITIFDRLRRGSIEPPGPTHVEPVRREALLTFPTKSRNELEHREERAAR